MSRRFYLDKNLAGQRDFHEAHRKKLFPMSIGMFGSSASSAATRFCGVWTDETKHTEHTWDAYYGLPDGSERNAQIQKMLSKGFVPLHIAAVGDTHAPPLFSEVWGVVEDIDTFVLGGLAGSSAINIAEGSIREAVDVLAQGAIYVYSMAAYQTKEGRFYALVSRRLKHKHSLSQGFVEVTAPGLADRHQVYRAWSRAMAGTFAEPRFAVADRHRFVSLWHLDTRRDWAIALNRSSAETRADAKKLAVEKHLEPSLIQSPTDVIVFLAGPKPPQGGHSSPAGLDPAPPHFPPFDEPRYTTIYTRRSIHNYKWIRHGKGFPKGFANHLEDQIESYIKKTTKYTRTPGCQLAIARNGKLVFARAYSFVGEEKFAVRILDCLRWGSCSKGITAAAVLKTCQDHSSDGFSLSTPVQKLVELQTLAGGALPSTTTRYHNILIRHLLSGLGGWKESSPRSHVDADWAGTENQPTILKALRKIHPSANYPLTVRQCASFVVQDPHNITHEPGTYYTYSGFGHILLGEAVRAFFNTKDYVAAVVPRLFSPLGITRMKRSTLRAPGDPRHTKGEPDVYPGTPGASNNTADPEPTLPNGDLDPDLWTVSPNQYTGNSITSEADGAWVGSAVDIARFMAAFDLPDGKNPNGISQSTAQMLLFEASPDLPSTPFTDFYNNGTKKKAGDYCRIGGEVTGGGSFIARGRAGNGSDPTDQISIAWVNNIDLPPGFDPLDHNQTLGAPVSDTFIMDLIRGVTKSQWDSLDDLFPVLDPKLKSWKHLWFT